jgi:hypothetical protein
MKSNALPTALERLIQPLPSDLKAAMLLQETRRHMNSIISAIS